VFHQNMFVVGSSEASFGVASQEHYRDLRVPVGILLADSYGGSGNAKRTTNGLEMAAMLPSGSATNSPDFRRMAPSHPAPSWAAIPQDLREIP
jgi:hypothetical protein